MDAFPCFVAIYLTTLDLATFKYIPLFASLTESFSDTVPRRLARPDPKVLIMVGIFDSALRVEREEEENDKRSNRQRQTTNS